MKAPSQDLLLSEVAAYYSDKLAEYGESPRGVDWNGEEGQSLRFEQLCKIVAPHASVSINDLGCGYGALLDFIESQFSDVTYCGLDVSASMVDAARKRYAGRRGIRFACVGEPDEVADYGVASGIFNVRQGHADSEWRAYMERTLDCLDKTSRKGFSFNCLTAYSDTEKMRDYLYYADPGVWFDFCKRRYSRNVALLHDYGLFEFTILVRKQI